MKWEDITKEELKELYFKKDLLKVEIANMFNVTKNQVSYKLAKFKLNKQKKNDGWCLYICINKIIKKYY